MRWLTYPALLALHELGINGMVRTLFSLVLVSLVLKTTLSTSLYELALAVTVYFALSSLSLLAREGTLLQRHCEPLLQDTGERPMPDSSRLLFQPITSKLQRRLNRERRQQLLLQQGLDEISHSARELEYSAKSVSRNAEGQSESARTAAVAVEQLTVNIGQVAALADESRQASHVATAHLAEGIGQLDLLVAQVKEMAGHAISTNELIQELNNQSRSISAMSETIHLLAFQTNILSLNAAVEAAHAGVHGRSFAVVATEVRKLARHAQESAAEIGRNIEVVQRHIASATEQVSTLTERSQRSAESAGTVRGLLAEVQQRTRQLTEQVIQVAVSTDQQKRAVVEIAELADLVRRGNVDNLQAADQTRSIAQHLTQLTG